ncbi:hypothetical protein POTOM_015126 [Populus tomentosa]|uniref:Uncharacterized protein n=1 Tax=Populus tomentosa TaxID=118781 RepID=A0A8X8ACZ2_POPTO|nr:hypothetical protein POTOM_015126 [Populus tomentosa]
MAAEGNEASNGWPLGLMSTRLRVMETIQAAPAEPYSLRIRSSSFSSFSSSNLDTESTASFFQDRSVPLGRLIGIRPGNGGLAGFSAARIAKAPDLLSHCITYIVYSTTARE